MEKDIPLEIEFLSSSEDDVFRIGSAKEIESILQQIAKKGTRVALYYDNENDFILTTLLFVNSNGLYLEQSPNEQDNQRIIESDKLVFVSSHFQVKVQFSVNHANKVVHQGYPAFNLPFPSSIYRLQRREYYRLAALNDAPLRCDIATVNSSAKRLSGLTIVDISGGGLGLICTESDTVLSVGETYNCQFNLPGLGTIKGTIIVRSFTLTTSPPGHTCKHAGCEFKNLDGQSTILLQRYVTNMQRKKKS